MRVCVIWGVLLAAFFCNASRADIELSLDASCSCDDSYASLALEDPAHLAPYGTINVRFDPDPTSLTATLPPPHADGDTTEGLGLDGAATIAASGLTVTYDSATGVLSIAGAASAATYETILHGIVYTNAALIPDTTPRVVTVVVDNSDTSDSQTSTVYFAGFAPPTGSDQLYEMLEDDTLNAPPFSFPFTWSTPPGPCGIQLVNVPAEGRLILHSNSFVDMVDGANAPDEFDLRFVPEHDENGIPYTTFTFQVRDKLHQLSAATYTYTINVTNVNDFPYVPDNVQVITNAGPQSIAGVVVTGPPNESGQTLTIDLLTYNNGGLFDVGPTIDSTGTLHFTPAVDQMGFSEVTIHFHDDGGTEDRGSDTNAIVFLIEVMTFPFKTGDILIADRGPYRSTGTILAMTPNGTTPETYSQHILTTELKDPYGIAMDFDGNILITDYQTGRGPMGGGLFKLDRYSLQLTPVSRGFNFVVPFGLAVDDLDGTIYVADSDANGFQGGIYQIDPDNNGAQTEIATGFHWLRGITTFSGFVFATDLGADTPGSEKLWFVDPLGFIAPDPLDISQECKHPDGLALDPTLGIFVIAEALEKKLVGIDLGFCGCQDVLSTGLPPGSSDPHDSLFNLPTHVIVDIDFDSFTSTYYVTDAPIDAPSGSRRLLRVNPDDGSTEVLSSGGFFEQPRGLFMVPPNPNYPTFAP
jgi:hypothetical protein